MVDLFCNCSPASQYFPNSGKHIASSEDTWPKFGSGDRGSFCPPLLSRYIMVWDIKYSPVRVPTLQVPLHQSDDDVLNASKVQHCRERTSLINFNRYMHSRKSANLVRGAPTRKLHGKTTRCLSSTVSRRWRTRCEPSKSHRQLMSASLCLCPAGWWSMARALEPSGAWGVWEVRCNTDLALGVFEM
jgi:hypothetical protein